MSDDYKTTLARNLTGSTPMMALVLGAMFTLLGLSGGITYHNLLPFPGVLDDVISGAVGLRLIACGLNTTRAPSKSTAPPSPHDRPRRRAPSR